MLQRLLHLGQVNVLLVNPTDVPEVISQILGWPVDELGDIVRGDNCYDTPHGRVRFVNFTDEINHSSPEIIHRRETYIGRLNKEVVKTNEAVIVMQSFKWRRVEGTGGLHFTTYPSKTLFLGQLGIAVVEDRLCVFRDKANRQATGKDYPFVRGAQ